MQTQVIISLTPHVNGGRVPKHGHSRRSGRTPEYRAWKRLTDRCYNPKCAAFENYGGRGITVCDRWRGPQGFQNFLADMGEKPNPKHLFSLERIDNNKGYSPENCRWATYQEQARNTRWNRLITYNNETLCLEEWATRLGMKSATLAQRLKRLPTHEAFTQPIRDWSVPGHYRSVTPLA